MKVVMIAEYALWKNPQGLIDTMKALKMHFDIDHSEKGGFIVRKDKEYETQI